MVGRAVPRALTFGHSPESGAFFPGRLELGACRACRGRGAFALGREGRRLDLEQLLPSRGSQSCVQRENG